MPPSGPLILLAVSVVLMRRTPRLARSFAAFAVAALWICSTGLVGNALLLGLEAAPASAADLARVQAIVVLGGGLIPASPEYREDAVAGDTLARLRYAARLAKQLDRPVLVSGGQPYGTRPEAQAMAEALEEMGVRARWKEAGSSNTAENAAQAAPILGDVKRIALVTSAWHMPRAGRAFARSGFEVVAAPTGYLTRRTWRWTDLLPSAAGLSQTRIALWELLGMLWYAIRA
jgi:uncharacterized SAM-binding protein YcdF (DUF218 family)